MISDCRNFVFRKSVHYRLWLLYLLLQEPLKRKRIVRFLNPMNCFLAVTRENRERTFLLLYLNSPTYSPTNCSRGPAGHPHTFPPTYFSFLQQTNIQKEQSDIHCYKCFGPCLPSIIFVGILSGCNELWG